MQEPRVLLVESEHLSRRTASEWPGGGWPTAGQGASFAGGWLTWRLVGGNGWELGRSALTYADRRTCEIGLAAVVTAVVASQHLNDIARRHQRLWGWCMNVGGQAVAVGSRDYRLYVECERALGRFVSLLPAAAARVVLPRQRPSYEIETGVTP